MNTTLKYIVGLIVIAAVVVGIVFAVKAGKKDVNVVVTDTTVSLCYVWNTPTGDHADLRLDLSGAGGTQVTGSFNFVPAEKDSKTGTFAGTAGAMDPMTSSRTADVIWQTNAEGMQTPEQLFIQFGEGSAAAGFGEMKDRGDGTYVYANPAKLSYIPTLSQVDCSDPALHGKTAGKLPAGSAANGDVSKLTANTWVWTSTDLDTGVTVKPKKPGVFTLQFGTDGHVSVTTDCNGQGGNYSVDSSGAIAFSAMMSTQMYCTESQETIFAQYLADAKSFKILEDGTTLQLALKRPGNYVYFAKK